MTEMLMGWLKKSSPKPTWPSLIAALRQPTVGQEQLADDIECQYSKHITNGSEESKRHTISSAVRLGKHPHRNNGEPAGPGIIIIDNSTPSKKQKMESNSGADSESSTRTTVNFGKHDSQHSDDEGPDVKRQKPNEES